MQRKSPTISVSASSSENSEVNSGEKPVLPSDPANTDDQKVQSADAEAAPVLAADSVAAAPELPQEAAPSPKPKKKRKKKQSAQDEQRVEGDDVAANAMTAEAVVVTADTELTKRLSSKSDDTAPDNGSKTADAKPDVLSSDATLAADVQNLVQAAPAPAPVAGRMRRMAGALFGCCMGGRSAQQEAEVVQVPVSAARM